MPLTDIQIRRFKPETKPFRKSDGGGFFVEVRPNGSELWRMAYRHNGKQKLLSFGAYPDTTLASARAKRLPKASIRWPAPRPNASAEKH